MIETCVLSSIAHCLGEKIDINKQLQNSAQSTIKTIKLAHLKRRSRTRLSAKVTCFFPYSTQCTGVVGGSSSNIASLTLVGWQHRFPKHSAFGNERPPLTEQVWIPDLLVTVLSKAFSLLMRFSTYKFWEEHRHSDCSFLPWSPKIHALPPCYQLKNLSSKSHLNHMWVTF